MSKVELIEMRDACMHMLLHLNQDFDDDLLSDSIKMIDEE